MPVAVYRRGTFAAASYVADDELIAAARGFEGLNRVVLAVSATPALRSSWDEMLLRAQLVLEGNDAWQTGLVSWLTEREGQAALDHHVRVYNMFDLIRALVGIVVHGDERWVDTVVAVAGDVNDPQCALAGVIVWDGDGMDVEEASRSVVSQDDTDFIFMWITGADVFQRELMAALGLRYALIERVAGQRPTWYLPEAADKRREITGDELSSFERFVSTRYESIHRVAGIITANSMGMI